MNIYIAGPMRGYPRFNFDAFERAAFQLRQLGNEVISPHEHDLEMGFDPDKGTLDGFDVSAALAWDITAISKCDAIALLPGWRDSKGAQLELHAAQVMKKEAYELDRRDFGQLHAIEEPEEDVLEEAIRITKGDRNVQYGDPQADFKRIAAIHTAILMDKLKPGAVIEPHEVALFFLGGKISRATWSPGKRDHWVDMGGYARCGWLCVQSRSDACHSSEEVTSDAPPV